MEVEQIIKSNDYMLILKFLKIERMIKENKNEKSLEQLNEISVEKLNKYLNGKYYLLKAKIYFKDEKYKKSIEFLKLCEKYWNDNQAKDEVLELYEMLAKSYSKIQYFKEAYHYSQLAKEWLKY